MQYLKFDFILKPQTEKREPIGFLTEGSLMHRTLHLFIPILGNRLKPAIRRESAGAAILLHYYFCITWKAKPQTSSLR